MGHRRPLEQSVVATRHGPARLLRSPAPGHWATLVLGHGAGGGADARDLRWLATDLPSSGVEVVRMEQPWRVAGKKVAARPAVLDEAWLDAVATVRQDNPLIVGGRSSGARVACRTATSVGAAGCVALAFPLNPPWRPEQTRFTELQTCGVPTLVVQGDRDQFGAASDFPELPASIRIVPLADADHEFARPHAVLHSSVRPELVAYVSAWLRETVPA